jgi:hypothetical protein
MESWFEIMRQARQFLAQNRDIIPLRHVEDVLAYGSVELYVVAGGVNIHTEEGNRTMGFEMALYLLCLELCNMGLGNRPYLPHPYLHEPVIVEPEEEVLIEDLVEDPQDQPDDPAVDPLDIGEDGVRVYGPFIGPIPDLPPMVHFPSGETVQDVEEKPKPKPEVKPKLESNSSEYIEPFD